MIRTAVIVAAGIGSRLKEITQSKPKGFLVLDKMPIIEESVVKLFSCGIEKILIGTGYLSEEYEELTKRYSQIMCVKNKYFKETGSMYTLYNLKEEINDDFLLLESDLIYDKKGITILMEDRHDNVILGSGMTNSGDEVFIEVDENKHLINMSKNRDELKSVYAELVGITKISIDTYQKMCEFSENRFKSNRKLDYEYALVGISKDVNIYIKKLENYAWCEIDDENHLERAEKVIYPKIIKKESSKGRMVKYGDN